MTKSLIVDYWGATAASVKLARGTACSRRPRGTCSATRSDCGSALFGSIGPDFCGPAQYRRRCNGVSWLGPKEECCRRRGVQRMVL